MARKLLFSLVSAALLSAPAFGLTGFPLIISIVPLLLLSSRFDRSVRSLLTMASLTAATMVLWAVSSKLAVNGNINSSDLAGIAIQAIKFTVIITLFHYVSKRATSALSYVILVCGWIAAEYLLCGGSSVGSCAILGVGFADVSWAVGWYSITGPYSGSLWVLVVNIAVFTAMSGKRAGLWIQAALFAAVPVLISSIISWTHLQTAVYSLYGNYVARASVFAFVLSMLYYVAYRFRRKNHLVD